MAVVSALGSWYFRKRIGQLEEAASNAAETQRTVLRTLISSAEETEFGRLYEFHNIKTYDQFRQNVPLQDYESLKPYIERLMKGEQNILWHSDINWFAKSSGTTQDKSKFIPVSFESLEDCHFKGGKDILAWHFQNNPESKIFDGKSLLIGGSHKINTLAENSFYGDLSAVLMNNLPFWVNLIKTPNLSIALMDDWEMKLEKMALKTMNENVTNITGVPTWTLVLFDKLLELTGKKNITEIWPNLELYIHGGVSFAPYREQFKRYISNPGMRYLETYNASEGFFGIQTESDVHDMMLMTDYGIFYEFITMDTVHSENPVVLSLEEVKKDENYAVVISTNSGLWRYVLGDTISFTSLNPFRFTITGRTKLFINAFGEELVIENAEKAIAYACESSNSRVREYTAAPIYLDDPENAGHEWLIEFETIPENLDYFTSQLDKKLKEINSDYEAKRHKDIALKMPTVKSMPANTFYNWLKQKGKLGGQHKVPRLSNDRKIVNEILELI
ncbi:MAG: GH3 auxin-responsive promoter family protein [Bacteroidia bacterium]|nr:GH3 auxin-responsive promoter family protein [Bacteroidia bacterium]